MAEDKTIVHSVSDLLSQTSKKTSACLIVVSGKASVGKMFKLDRAGPTIGRSTDVDIMLDDEGVLAAPRQNCRRADGSVQLVDLNSTNGTFNNGDKIDVAALHDGDKIQIGSATILKFSYQDSYDEALQKNLYDSATRDGLTHIYNKKYFVDTLRKEFAYCIRHRVALSGDDGHRPLQENQRHLRAPSRRLRPGTARLRINDTIRAEDIFARYGGEEFVVLLREAPEDKAFILAERLRRLIETTDFTFNGQQMKVTLSAGIATLQDAEYSDIDDYIAAADKHLYRAKQAGRNRVEARMLGG